MRLFALASVPVLLLAACAETAAIDEGDAAVAAEPALEESCGKEDWQNRVGDPITSLAGLTLPSATRIIRPDEMVTTDYSPARLNIEVDETGVITEVFCG